MPVPAWLAAPLGRVSVGRTSSLCRAGHVLTARGNLRKTALEMGVDASQRLKRHESAADLLGKVNPEEVRQSAPCTHACSALRLLSIPAATQCSY
jgi:hypothetical protein